MTLTPAAMPEPAIREPGRLRTALLLGLCCFVIYNANWRAISAGDCYPARYLPFVILHHHMVTLDPLAGLISQGRGDTAFWMVNLPDGRSVSLYPIVVPVLLAPLYVPAVAYLEWKGWTEARVDRIARIMEKLSASLVASLSAALLFLLLRRRATHGVALLLTVAYAFGTTTWVISSQALWQHGLAQLMIIVVLLLLTMPCSIPRALAAGALLMLIVANRPPDAILAAALGVFALLWAGWRRVALLVAGAAIPAIPLLSYNTGVTGHILGGYGRVGTPDFFHFDLFPGMAGLLVSPARGLLVFSPFLLFLLLAWRNLPREREERILTLAMAAGVILQIALYAKADWRSGISWGPRFMTDLLPFLMWMLVPVVSSLRGILRHCFEVAVGVAILIELIGAFWYNGTSDLPLFEGPQGVRAAWDWRNAPFIGSWSQRPPPADLLLKMQGGFDSFDSVTRGQTAVITGWALAGHWTPWQVGLFIDGRHVVATRTFLNRPDVRKSLREANPSGWRIAVDTADVTPGEHRVALLAWAFDIGEPYYLAERTMTVRMPAPADPSLEESARNAAARLREHQQADGSWLTAFTGSTQFRNAQPELNTYLTSLLVEWLDPLAKCAGLEVTIDRAQSHLTSQIESGGLVRYHGLPDGPAIGTLGCVITPDTDDTALVWRVAPSPDRKRLAAALEVIARYRRPDGLYRTWLAPREAYQCLDPGSDPNPADLGIQMHLLLWLREVRPAAAHDLCQALQPVVNEDRVWVYYRGAPLVPMLRLADLRRAGCDLQLPAARERTDVPGQQIWVDVVRALRGGADGERIEALLHELARDDFARLRANPPLLYHNDLTATVRRYYWSEDAGYALWLRLHDKHEPYDRRRTAG